jgi:hypothetical protein
MFIKNQSFNDEETLLDAMFDFNIGTVSAYTQALVDEINAQLAASKEYQEYLRTLTDEDDKVELYQEERDLRLAEKFLERFDSFAIDKAQLFGIKDGNRELLYEIDMV